MFNKRIVTVILGLLLGLTSIATAQDLIIGYQLVEYYDDITGSTVADLTGDSKFPYNPDEVLWIEKFETASNRADTYGTRVGGYVIPPQTGDYTFYIASDDTSELYLSPDDDWHNTQLIASVTGWTTPKLWTKYPSQQSEPIALVAGNVYYIEALHKEAGGGDNLAVGWTGPGIADSNTITVIDGQYLSPYITGEDDPLIAQYYKVRVPVPADEGLAASTEPTLSWEPIIYADSYNVYLSTDPNAVTNGTVTANNTSTTSYTTSGLETNTQYYWRVDGIGSDGTVYQGNVWSFTVASKSAAFPAPPNNILFVDPNADLSWIPGLGAIEHHLYFGTNADDVVVGNNGTDKGVLQETSFALDTLERGVVYYWRVDEFDGTDTYTGALWQFQVEYDVPLTDDPNLTGWWKMEEGAGRVIDWSGHGFDGQVIGDPEWVPGVDGGALSFSGNDDYIEIDANAVDLGIDGDKPRTVCGWMYTRTINYDGGSPWSVGNTAANRDYAIIGRSGDQWQLNHWYADFRFDMPSIGEWIHLTQTYDGSIERLYRNGELVVTFQVVLDTAPDRNFRIGDYRNQRIDGIMDDVRVYTLCVTKDEIPQIMRGNLLRAWSPMPKHDSEVDVEQAGTLHFEAGDDAVMHDIYIGTIPDAVEEALADANTYPEYQGRQAETTLDVSDIVSMGNTFYWRVDELDPNGLLTKGRVWSFHVVDYLIIDNFETYDDSNNRVFQTWKDGYGFTSPEPGYEGNGTGSAMGNANAPFMETATAFGAQSAPFSYSNTGAGDKAAYSETFRTFETMQDLTRLGITHLQLSFYGSVSNARDRLYVALEDASGAVAEVAYPDNAAVSEAEWHEWSIPLSDFVGIDLQAIKTIYLGVGNRTNPMVGGTGTLYIDNILLTIQE